MKYIVLIYVAVMSLISFIQFGVDKHKAQAHLWRIPEKVLMLTAFFGGAIGAWLGMHVFHHKTQHPKFAIGIPAFVILHLLILCLLLLFFG